MQHKALPATLSIVMMNDQNGNGSPNFGDQITFAISPSNIAWNQVNLAVTKDGVNVLSGLRTPADLGLGFGLSTATWQSEAGEAVAQLIAFDGRKEILLAELIFSVAA